MIIKESVLDVLDNSGALKVKCFHIFKKNCGSLGDRIIVSIKNFKSGKKVKKGEVYKAIIISVKVFKFRKTGYFFGSKKNSVVLWKRNEEGPVGTRLKAFVPFELRFFGFLKVVLLAKGSF